MSGAPSRAEAAAMQVLEQARSEFAVFELTWNNYRIDAELVASLLFGLGVQLVPDLKVGDREYAGFLDAESRLVAVEASHHEHRRRFSIAHEIGHFVLHFLPAPAPVLYACTSADMEVRPEATAGTNPRLHHRQEAEANLFASALLMPEPALRAMHRVTSGKVAALAKHFDVSPQAMEIRLTRLKLTYR